VARVRENKERSGAGGQVLTYHPSGDDLYKLHHHSTNHSFVHCIINFIIQLIVHQFIVSSMIINHLTNLSSTFIVLLFYPNKGSDYE